MDTPYDWLLEMEQDRENTPDIEVFTQYILPFPVQPYRLQTVINGKRMWYERMTYIYTCIQCGEDWPSNVFYSHPRLLCKECWWAGYSDPKLSNVSCIPGEGYIIEN